MPSKPASVAVTLTPPGAAAIAVVRLRGPQVVPFLQKCFSKTPRVGRCVHGDLRDGEKVLDDPIVVLGEQGEWADVSLHGGVWVLLAMLDLTRRHGFDVLDGKIPLAQTALDDSDSILEREVAAHLPLARTELGVQALLAQPGNWRRALGDKPDAAEILGDRSLWWLLNPPQVAIVGEPNVGKSTLANQIFGQTRSITADLPGTTRDWVGDMANLDGLAIHLIDTPGRRETQDPIERAAIDASGEIIARSDLTILVLDATRKPESRLAGSITVINKIDQPAAWDFTELNALAISAKIGSGLQELRELIRKQFDMNRRGDNQPRWWTDRQREIISRARANPALLAELF
ncbi:MAG: GTPase [Tepidisphaeraceae bacterium]